VSDRIVVDASVALKWVTRAPDSAGAEAVLARFRLAGHELCGRIRFMPTA
jgi:hypothetical protein